MKILVTGGAGFIGRWVVKNLLDKKKEIYVLDNLSNGSLSNLEEFKGNQNFKELIEGDIQDRKLLDKLFKQSFDICIHLAARINVQDSIANPRDVFNNDVAGTFNLLEKAKEQRTKFIFISTCMVYAPATTKKAISESYQVKPASPYAAAKLSGEHLTLSYYYAYNLPTVVCRPFNTYGPFQKSSGEGGVIAIFIRSKLRGEKLTIFGNGTQTRDFLYVEDCAEFITKASFCEKAIGQIINAGSGYDISINNLAKLITRNPEQIIHVPHIHPQSEIKKLKCNPNRAKRLLRWRPVISLEEGLKRTGEWISQKV